MLAIRRFDPDYVKAALEPFTNLIDVVDDQALRDHLHHRRRSLGYAEASVRRLVWALHDDGIIRTTRHPADQRGKAWKLTELGRHWRDHDFTNVAVLGPWRDRNLEHSTTIEPHPTLVEWRTITNYDELDDPKAWGP